jgi:hypothetical protein
MQRVVEGSRLVPDVLPPVRGVAEGASEPNQEGGRENGTGGWWGVQESNSSLGGRAESCREGCVMRSTLTVRRRAQTGRLERGRHHDDGRCLAMERVASDEESGRWLMRGSLAKLRHHGGFVCGGLWCVRELMAQLYGEIRGKQTLNYMKLPSMISNIRIKMEGDGCHSFWREG